MVSNKCILQVVFFLFLTASLTGDARGQSRVDLDKAIEEFNRKAQANEIGAKQPPLTMEEVVAAIRRWDREKLGPTHGARDEYDEIARSQSLEKNDSISFIDSWGPLKIGEEYYYFDVWWIDLRIERAEVADGLGRTPGRFNLRIRDRTISSRKLTPEEVEAFLKRKRETELYLLMQKMQRDRRSRQRTGRGKDKSA